MSFFEKLPPSCCFVDSLSFDLRYVKMNVCEVFYSQVQQNPEDIAVVYEEAQLTYKQLHFLSSVLAYNLVEKFVFLFSK
jgi:non-ribosomal peptide synthetase component F